ncbi:MULTISPECIES: hypothetical protein [Streptomyces]|uniref:hypothetical protein n=1 Tax=Streptomyces TaxID=1883 RepID=UPI003429CE0E
MVNGEVARICDATAHLCEPLHDAFAYAHQRHSEQLPELQGPSHGWLRSHMVRGLVHHRLLKASLGPWTLSGNHRRNGELWLTDGDYRVRLLHGFSDDHVPPPGSNHARRAYYRNLPLPPAFQVPAFGPENNKLLILWRVGPDGAPAFRVVRTTGTWKFGATAEVDLDFPLMPTADELRKLRFEPQDDSIELDLPDNEEMGDGDGTGGFSW